LIFHLPILVTVLIDIASWLLIHLGVSFIMSRRLQDSFDPSGWLYQKRGWENNGQIYTRVFKVKSWKKLLPDGAALFKGGFQKKRLRETNWPYFKAFIRETCRAEITHWIVFLCSFLFFLWNLWWVGLIMIVYAAAANLPCIITQRYNRTRLRRLVSE
jgi:glycosyl-4,4'-diaponeurosporenoate acyltransferase